MTLIRSFRDEAFIADYGTVVVRDAWEGTDADADDVDPDDESDPHDGMSEASSAVGAGGFDEFFSQSTPGGTLVVAGISWLQCHTRGTLQDLTLELHDGPPPLDAATWEDVAETPFGSDTGLICIDSLVPMDVETALTLSGPGLYRVRVSRRFLEPAVATERDPDDTDDVDDVETEALWLLQFWPAPEPGTLPVRLRRSAPLVSTPKAGAGWSERLGYTLDYLPDLVALLADAGDDAAPVPVTVQHLGAAGASRAGRGTTGPGWLDEPLHEPPSPPLPTGHADLDAARREEHALQLAAQEAEQQRLAQLARGLGVPPPSTPRASLDLLTACGLLQRVDTPEGPGYLKASQPPRVDEVLDLPREEVQDLDTQAESDRFDCAGADVVAIAAWAQAGALVPGREDAGSAAGRLTVRTLADLLMAGPDETRAVLGHAADTGLLDVDGDLDRLDAPLTLTATVRGGDQNLGGYEPLPSAAWEKPGGPDVPWTPVREQPAWPATAVEAPEGGWSEDGPVVITSIGRWTSQDDRRARTGSPPLGAAPAAGFVADGELVLPPHRGARAARSRIPGRPVRALETRMGVVVHTEDGDGVLVRWDGSTEPVSAAPLLSAQVSEDGLLLAVLEGGRFGRGVSRLRMCDLATGSWVEMPWDRRNRPGLVAVRAGAVIFVAEPGTSSGAIGEAAAGSQTWSWQPGSQPQPVLGPGPARATQVDPLTGTWAYRDDRGAVSVVTPEGSTTTVRLGPDPLLAPGGDRLFTYRYDPPAVSFFDVPPGPGLQDVTPGLVCWLPAAAARPGPGPGSGAVWEDRWHLLLPLPWWEHDIDCIRLDTRSGRLEAVPVAENAMELCLTEPYLLREQ